MNDSALLSDLENKIKEMVSALERERERNVKSDKSVELSGKLSSIEEKVKSLIVSINQLEEE
tara:strand:+ start:198 stop:383 length:186 start_codon:yes stop_codon:yes gene_type:complete